MNPSFEGDEIRALIPLRKASGRQHSFVPAHIRLITQTAFGLSDCWHWRGHITKFGYGRLTFNGRMQLAHRVSYETFKGSIPDGLFVMHSCDNRGCINPEHLSLGTYADNRRDCLRKGRWSMKAKRDFDHHSNTVTPEALMTWREMRSRGISYAEIGRQTGAGTMVVWYAINKRFGGKEHA